MKRAGLAHGTRAVALCAALIAGACSAEAQRAQATNQASAHCLKIPPEAFPPEGRKVKTHTDFAQSHFRKRIVEFADAPLGCGQIVLLGDSLIELNDWSETLPGGSAIRNRGISGDTSDGVLVRLDEIVASRPRAVFLMIGTNDLTSRNSPLKTAANITAITRQIRSQSPDSMIFVQTVFPVRWGSEWNIRVRAINMLLKMQSMKSGFILLDTHALMVDGNGMLNPAYTNDGLHLNEAGYAVWSKLISDTLHEHDLLKS